MSSPAVRDGHGRSSATGIPSGLGSRRGRTQGRIRERPRILRVPVGSVTSARRQRPGRPRRHAPCPPQPLARAGRARKNRALRGEGVPGGAHLGWPEVGRVHLDPHHPARVHPHLRHGRPPAHNVTGEFEASAGRGDGFRPLRKISRPQSGGGRAAGAEWGPTSSMPSPFQVSGMPAWPNARSQNSLTECVSPVATTKSSGLSCCSISHMHST